MPFSLREYENKYSSFEGFQYQSKSVLTDNDLTLLDVLKSQRFFDKINLKSDKLDLIIEDMGGDTAGRFNPFENQIILDCRLLKMGFYFLRDCYIHELTHKIIGLGHGTDFFLMCCVISCRYYQREAWDLVSKMALYDCQDVRVYNGKTYTPLKLLGHSLSGKIGDFPELDFQDFINEIDYLASTRYTIEEIADYLKERDNILIYV